MPVMKLIPHLAAWFGIVVVLLRGFPGRRNLVGGAAGAGFLVGVGGALLLFRSFPGEAPFSLIRDAVGGSFLLLWGVAVGAIYRTSIRRPQTGDGERAAVPLAAGAGALLAGLLAGAISAARLSSSGGAVLFLALALAAIALVVAAAGVERVLPPSIAAGRPALMAAVVALLLYSSSFMLRLDLFSPLTMKVMKFTHDFIHQFFESMLIPDHLFIRSRIWGYIGLLFGKEVGFWGGLIIWFAPVVLVLLAIWLERLPSVAHIRQGAQRRRLVAAALRARRLRLAIPGVTVVILAAGAYQSQFPTVEYWDPKPIAITADPSGEIVIPYAGEVNLKDGKLHKYLLVQGGREVRFFVLLTPNGEITVDLDACAICKPDGYGQTEGTVICYYCKTLIPLETVGKPGGCNPVPVSFTEKEDGVHLDALTLLNTWNTTVQATARVKEGGK